MTSKKPQSGKKVMDTRLTAAISHVLRLVLGIAIVAFVAFLVAFGPNLFRASLVDSLPVGSAVCDYVKSDGYINSNTWKQQLGLADIPLPEPKDDFGILGYELVCTGSTDCIADTTWKSDNSYVLPNEALPYSIGSMDLIGVYVNDTVKFEMMTTVNGDVTVSNGKNLGKLGTDGSPTGTELQVGTAVTVQVATANVTGYMKRKVATSVKGCGIALYKINTAYSAQIAGKVTGVFPGEGNGIADIKVILSPCPQVTIDGKSINVRSEAYRGADGCYRITNVDGNYEFADVLPRRGGYEVLAQRSLGGAFTGGTGDGGTGGGGAGVIVACGNSVIDPGEDCEGTDLGGKACIDFGFTGTLSCKNDCSFDKTQCCGDGVCAATEDCNSCAADCSCSSTQVCLSTGVCEEACLDASNNVLAAKGQCVPNQNPLYCDTSKTVVANCEQCGCSGSKTCQSDPTKANYQQCIDRCGNQVKDGQEQCDTNDFGGQTCQSLQFDGGTLGCTSECMLDTSACTVCGDGVKNGQEFCDTGDLDGKTCISEGYPAGGTLTCNADCTFNNTQCCGDGQCSGAENCSSCAIDCACGAGKICMNNACAATITRDYYGGFDHYWSTSQAGNYVNGKLKVFLYSCNKFMADFYNANATQSSYSNLYYMSPYPVKSYPPSGSLPYWDKLWPGLYSSAQNTGDFPPANCPSGVQPLVNQTSCVFYRTDSDWQGVYKYYTARRYLVCPL